MTDTKSSAFSAATAATASSVPVVQGGANKLVAMTAAGAAMIEAANAGAQKTLLSLSGTNTGDQTNVSGNAGTATLAADSTKVANTTPSAVGLAVLAAIDAAAARTAIGAVIGTNVQAYDADLDAWAGKTAPSGTAVGTSDSQTLTNKRITKRVVTLTDVATVTPNADTTDKGILTSLSQTTTFANPTGTPTDGQELTIRIKSAAAQAVSFGNKFRATEVDLPTATQGSAITERWLFEWDAADSMWDILAINLGA